MNTSTPKRKVTGRGCLRKLWDGPGRRWYMVCPCCPGQLYTLGPVGADMNAVMAQASRNGWRYDPLIGWSCPECVRRAIHAQLDEHTLKQIQLSNDLHKAAEKMWAERDSRRSEP